VPITTRQLEALIRLCQARASSLRDFRLEEDALDVVELMIHSLEQVHSDKLGGVVDPIRGDAGGTSNCKIKRVRKLTYNCTHDSR
jgi:DNA replicative helicase MCM subunit Mcm2 (Cdc46/Mcm family)